jgi:hypothetical protein
MNHPPLARGRVAHGAVRAGDQAACARAAGSDRRLRRHRLYSDRRQQSLNAPLETMNLTRWLNLLEAFEIIRRATLVVSNDAMAEQPLLWLQPS